MSDVAVRDDWKEAARLDDPFFYVEDNRALFPADAAARSCILV